MGISRKHIAIVLGAVLFLFASCSNDKAKVIPRKTMARIYADMLVTDQWIMSSSGMRMIADTSLVYEPILEKYGYDSDDYRMSIDVYMNDPERFARIFRTTVEILDERILELEKEQARLDAIAKLPRVESDFKVSDYVQYLDGEPYVHYFDSLDVILDSATLMYRLVSIERADTLYDGLRMVIKDSSAVTDSLKDAPDISLLKIAKEKADASLQRNRVVREMLKNSAKILK